MRSRPVHIDRLPGWTFVAAIALVLITLAVRWALAGLLKERSVFLIFLPAVALSAYVGGLRCGLLATFLSAAAASIVFQHLLPGNWRFQPAEAVQILLFVTCGITVSALIEALHRGNTRHAQSINSFRSAEARLTAEHAVTRILADSDSLSDAAPMILRAIRDSLRAPVGLLWLPDESGAVLQCACDSTSHGPRLETFARRCREFSFRLGIGLPGRVWESVAPAWIADVVHDSNFPRAPVAAEAGICSGMAFPIRAGGEFFGVFEFFTDQPSQPDPALLNMMGAIGSEIGQFILRRRAEQELVRSQRQLSDFVENANIGLHWVGPDGTILWANKAELEMLGYRPEDYIGRHVNEFHVDPEATRQILDCLSRNEQLKSFSARMKCRDGSIKHVVIDSSALFEDGEFIHSRCFIRDLTEQVRAEEELREKAENLRLALAAGQMGTWEWEIKTGRVAWSPGLEEIHGIPAGGFGGTFEHFIRDVHPEDRPRVSAQIEQTVANRADHLIEYRLLLGDGSVKWVEGRGSLVCGADGAPLRMIGVCADITRRKHAEQERADLLARERHARADAERASKAKDEFLAVLSHELRTPLTPVLLTVTLMENSPDLSEEQRRDLQTIRRNIELEAHLIDDLLDLTRIARGKLQLDMEPIDMHVLVRSAADIAHRADEVDLVQELGAEAHSVRADPARLQQVLWNLLNNAHKFTPPGGAIKVRTSNTAVGWIRVEVIDSGVGIDPQMLPTIFTAFTQGHAESRRFGGLGLGLAISRALVEAQGGRLYAQSDGRGRGATFTLEMPTISVPAPAPEPPIRGAGDPASTRRPLRILIVEDHDATRIVMTKLLAKLGHAPVPAVGVESAIRALQDHPVDLVISDIGLPDGTGHDLMRRIRTSSEVPGIALSGYGMDEDLRRSEEAGFAEHLIKPVDVHRLQAAIHRVADHALSI